MDSVRTPRGRYYPALLAALVLTLSGCATTYGLGQTALAEGRYADAAVKFETTLKEHPDRTDALVGLGITRYKQNGYDEAIAHLDEAIRQDPKRADARLYLGLSNLERGDNGAAAQHLRAFRDLIQSARVAGQVDEALELIQSDHALSQRTRRFVATSLESALKAEQDLRGAQWAFSPWPNDGYDNWFSWDLTR
jgi:tetratricopeptide (TPR) repeat protein